MLSQTPPRTSRLEARITPEMLAIVKRAAEVEGRSLSDFVVTAAREAAQKTLETVEILRLSVEDQKRFAEALLNPPEPTEALREAFVKHRELLGSS